MLRFAPILLLLVVPRVVPQSAFHAASPRDALILWPLAGLGAFVGIMLVRGIRRLKRSGPLTLRARTMTAAVGSFLSTLLVVDPSQLVGGLLASLLATAMIALASFGSMALGDWLEARRERKWIRDRGGTD